MCCDISESYSMKMFFDKVSDFLVKNKNSESFMISLVNEINSYTGSLEDLVWENMEDFDSFCSDMKPWEIAKVCFYGGFKPCNKYFKFNCAGNICSTDFVIYDDCDIEEIVDALKEFPYDELPDCIKEIYDECFE